MKDIKYSSMRARYNRYCKVVDFFSYYGLTWLSVVFPVAIGGGMFESGIYNIFFNWLYSISSFNVHLYICRWLHYR